MSINLYDSALVEKIKKWVKNDSIRILKPDESRRLFEIVADENNDAPIKLPLISISRAREVTILNTQKQPKSYDGILLHSDGSRGISLNAIPIKLEYQVDIYAGTIEEADELLRQFVYKFINNPTFTIQIQYNGIDYHHNFNIYMGNEVVDNSDIQEKLFPDQLTRYTINLMTDDAYLFYAPIGDNVVVEDMDMEVKFQDEVKFKSEN